MNFLELAKSQPITNQESQQVKPERKNPVYLTSDQKLKIIEEYQTTDIWSGELAEKYNVGKTTIFRILKGVSKKGQLVTKINEKYFQSIDTRDKAYFLGFITSDGNVGFRCSDSIICQIEINKRDVEILQEFNKYSESEYPIRERIRKRKTNYSEVCSIYISNTNFAKHLLTHGVTPEKSTKLEFPTTIPDHLMPHYIRGLIDGDGGWHLNKANKNQEKDFNLDLFFCSPVESFIVQFQEHLMEKCGLNKIKIQPNNRNTCYSLRYRGNQQAKRTYDYLYLDGGPRLTRKHKRATLHFQKHGLLPLTNEYNNDNIEYHVKPKSIV